MSPSVPDPVPANPQNPTPTGDHPVIIGLLGGIAAGKSTVAGLFSEHGFLVVDADAVAREVVAEPAVAQRIRDRFGAAVMRADGSLDRAELASLVFCDPSARKDLEAITHPEVRARIGADLQAARGRGEPVVLDVPLLLEGGLIEACDHCVFLEVDPAVRRARAAERGWEKGELERREANQAPLEDKRARCGFTVQNDGDLLATRAQVAEIVGQL